jgi:signal transduction histidine kinase
MTPSTPSTSRRDIVGGSGPTVQRTLSTSFVTLSLAVLLGSGGLLLVPRLRTEGTAAYGQQKLAAQLGANTVSAFVVERFGVLETAAWAAALDTAPAPARLTVMQGLIGSERWLTRVALVDDDGVERASYSRLPGQPGPPPALFDEALAQVKKVRRHVSPVYFDPVTNEPRVLLAVPVLNALRERRGALLAELNLRLTWLMVATLRVGQSGYVYVVDRRGRLIAFGDPTRVLRGEVLTSAAPVATFLHGSGQDKSPRVWPYKGLTGHWVVGAHAALDTPDWAVVAETPWREAYGGSLREAAIGFGLVAAIAGAAWLAGRRLARRLAGPVVNLMNAAVRIASGERHSPPADVTGPRELANLAAAFNSMTAQLQDSLERLERQVAEVTRAHEQIERLNAGLEQRVVQRTRALEAANSELEAFAYSVSHDLRAPLRAIDGYTLMLAEEKGAELDDEGRRICGVIRSEAQRMAQLIDDLLAFSRLGRVEMSCTVLPMDQMARSVFFDVTTDDARERIDFRLADLLPAVGDPRLIQQVWANLLSNAVKFSGKRPRASIEVSSTRDGDTIAYSVRDNGAGFDMAYADKLFGVFQRLHSQRQFEGTGVGLAIVRRIVQRHGGRVWAEGAPDGGATFHFTLQADARADNP